MNYLIFKDYGTHLFTHIVIFLDIKVSRFLLLVGLLVRQHFLAVQCWILGSYVVAQLKSNMERRLGLLESL